MSKLFLGEFVKRIFLNDKMTGFRKPGAFGSLESDIDPEYVKKKT